jgi:hypothetical protein
MEPACDAAVHATKRFDQVLNLPNFSGLSLSLHFQF